MIELIADLPANVLGLKASGQVSAKDYESVVIPAVEARFSLAPHARLLYLLGDDFTGFDGAALWEDAQLRLRHLGGWERIAVVTDVDWIRAAARVFGFTLPSHVRVFHNREAGAARAWVGEPA